MEQQILDGIRKLKPEQFSTLCENLKDDDKILIHFTNASISKDARVLETVKNSLVDTIFSDAVLNYCVNDNDEIIVSTEAYALVFSGGDLKWWNENNRRLNKIRDAISTRQVQQASKPKSTAYDKDAKFSIAIADLTEEGLVHVDFTQGTKAECLQWLNKMIVRHTDLNENSFIVFDLHFKEEHLDYLNYANEWKTLDELVKDGKVTV